MVGAVDSIIGADKNAVKVFTDYYPQKYVFPDSKATKTTFNAVILEIDTHSGRSVSIKRVNKII
jgi:calcineurin-like phosphoesterase